VRLLCRVLKVARSSFYDWMADRKPMSKVGNASLSVHVRAIHRRSRGTYGSPRIHAELKSEGHRVGRHRVARLMREMGLSGTPKRRFRVTTTRSKHTMPVAENVLQRDFHVDVPNRVWVGDITYLSTAAGFVYLSVLLDLYSRKVVGWSLASHMHTELCMNALNQAITTRSPGPGLLHHSDRGSQYTSGAYQGALAAISARPSMSRKGDCWDNAVAESFFGTLEQELVRSSPRWADEAEARKAVGDYIHRFYNAQRRHSTLGYLSPVDFELRHKTSARAA